MNRNVNQIEDKQFENEKEFITPTKVNSFLEFKSVVSATATATSNENEIQKKKKSLKKSTGGLEISFHIKEAWNIFEVCFVTILVVIMITCYGNHHHNMIGCNHHYSVYNLLVTTQRFVLFYVVFDFHFDYDLIFYLYNSLLSISLSS